MSFGISPEELERIKQAQAGQKAKEAAEDAAAVDFSGLAGIDPETNARIGSAVDSGRSLRGRPLVAGIAAQRMGTSGLKKQFAAMSGKTPDQQLAATQQGATMGADILGRFGGAMVGEAQDQFSFGQRQAMARSSLVSGQGAHALTERLLDLAHEKRLDLGDFSSEGLREMIAQALAASQKLGLFDGSGDPAATAPLPPALPLR